MFHRCVIISVLLSIVLSVSALAQEPAPGPITGLTATPLVGGQCLLQWTNPTTPGFTGVRIVINGDHQPTHPNDGFVYEEAAPSNSQRNHPVLNNHDYRWRLGRKYFYSLYAHDAANNYSPPAYVEVTMEDRYFSDDFEGYSVGQLQTVGVDHYVLGERDGGWMYYISPQNNVDQINIVTGDAYSGSKAARIRNVPGNNLESRVQFSFEKSMKTNFGDIQDGINIAKLSFRFKSLTNVGDYFWVVTIRDWQTVADDAFCMVRGSDNNLQILNTANGGWTTVVKEVSYTPNVWHRLDMVSDTRQSGMGSLLTDYYLDGDCVATGTHTGNGGTAKVRCVELWQYQRPGSAEMTVLIDDISLGSAARRAPVVTGPFGLIPFEIADVTWDREDPNVAFSGQLPPPLYGPYVDPTSVSACQVKMCLTDDPGDPAPVYDSGEVPGNDTLLTCGPIPFDMYLWSFAREKVDGGWGPWSRQGADWFIVVFGECFPPMINGPASPYIGGRPTVTFEGCPHSMIRMKAYTSNVDPETEPNPVYDSGIVQASAFAYPIGPLPSGNYYIYLKIGSATGWGGWSPGFQLTVNRSAEPIDIRHMNEPNILTTNQPAPNDGFGKMMGGFDEGTCTAAISSPTCGNTAMVVTDIGGASGRLLRQHRVDGIDLDKGVTIVWAAAIDQGGSDSAGGMNWRMSGLLVADRDPSGEFRMSGVKLRNSSVGVCSIDAVGATTDGVLPNSAAWTPTTAYRILRLTGHNMVLDDYNSTVWKLYINENPTPAVVSNGTMTGSVIEVDAGYRAGWGTQDFIALGQGSTNITGVFQYDWVAVNGGGDYAPGEWDPFSGTGTYPSIGTAKIYGVEPRMVSISGPSVITKILTHTEWIGDPPVETTVQDGYYAQDITASGASVSGARVVTSDTQGGAIAPGAKIISLSGVMLEQDGGAAIVNPSVTIQGTAAFAPVVLRQQNIFGPCIGPTGGANTCGMLVRFFGKCVLSQIDPGGMWVFYLDDGSGAIDGSELIDGQPVPGIRCSHDSVDPLFNPPEVGDYVLVEGIAAYERAVRLGPPDVDLGNVRQIVGATYTILAPGMP